MRARFALTVLAWILAGATFLMVQGELIAPGAATAALSTILVFYPATEVWLYVRRGGGTIVSPVVLCSVLQFILPFGLTNMLLLLPELTQRRLGIYATDAVWVNKALFLAFVGSFGVWTGFRSSLARRIGSEMRRWLLSRHLLRRRAEVNWIAVAACAAISTAVRLYAMANGIFGYGSEVEQMASLANETQFIRLATQLGTAALLVLAVAYYQAANRRALMVLITWTLNEVVWGFVSGFKSQVVFPLLAVALCKWLVTRKVPAKLLWLSVLAVALAYTVIEPLRAMRFSGYDLNMRDLKSVASALATIANGAQTAVTVDQDVLPTYAQVASRLNLTMVAARAVAYRDERGENPDDPPFLKNIVMAPAYALLPRVLWPEKPTTSTGAWFSSVVGSTRSTAIGMSPVAYLYLAGGVSMVLVGFALVGVLQRMVQEALLVPYAGAAVAFVGMLGAVATVDSEFYSFIIEFLRYLPLMIVLQLLAFRGERQRLGVRLMSPAAATR